jgi:outer membrane protein insertion porin family
LTLEATTPGSDLSFFKLDYRGQLFQPLSDNYTMRLHTELGYGDGYGSTNGLPFYENYYAGGFNSVRGARLLRLTSLHWVSDFTPLGFLICSHLESNTLPTSQNTDVRSERWSLTNGSGNRISAPPWISTLPPNGSGSLSESATVPWLPVTPTPRLGVPRGPKVLSLKPLTWVTALGPLSFALAMPIKKPDNAETQIFQFSLGQTF